jgi:hypothetical protein
VLQLVLAGDGANVTLTLSALYWSHTSFVLALRGEWCCTPGGATTTSDVDYGTPYCCV